MKKIVVLFAVLIAFMFYAITPTYAYTPTIPNYNTLYTYTDAVYTDDIYQSNFIVDQNWFNEDDSIYNLRYSGRYRQDEPIYLYVIIDYQVLNSLYNPTGDDVSEHINIRIYEDTKSLDLVDDTLDYYIGTVDVGDLTDYALTKFGYIVRYHIWFEQEMRTTLNDYRISITFDSGVIGTWTDTNAKIKYGVGNIVVSNDNNYTAENIYTGNYYNQYFSMDEYNQGFKDGKIVGKEAGYWEGANDVVYNGSESVGYANPQSSYDSIEGYNNARDYFFNNGFGIDDNRSFSYEAGFIAGEQTVSPITFVGLISSAGMLLNIIFTTEIFKGITIGLFVLIPLLFALLGLFLRLRKGG